MKCFQFLIIALTLVFSFSVSCSSEKDGFQFKQDTELKQIKANKPVKIKLKRTSTGKYSWELTGDDADEIIKIDKKLRKVLDEK